MFNFFKLPSLQKPIMGLPSTLFCLLLSVTLASGHLHPDDRTIRWPRKGDPEEGMKAQTRIKSRQHRSLSSQGNLECQEGNPLGASYSGERNVTASGRPCQSWPAAGNPEVGEHNYCRNPDGDLGGVWCYGTDMGRLSLPNWMNFGKSPNGRGGHFCKRCAL